MIHFLFFLIIVILILYIVYLQNANEILKFHIKRMSETYSQEVKTNSVLRHEWKGFLEEVDYFLDRNDVNSLEVIRHVIDENEIIIDKTNNEIFTLNTVINSVFSIVNDKAKNKNISLICDLCIPSELSIDSLFLIVAFRNILMNALDATSDYCIANNVERAEINVKSSLINDYLIIKVTNPCNNKLDYSLTDIIPSSKGELYHGNGIRLLKYVAKKNNGEFKITFDNNKCEATLTLQNCA